jgi:hypothetical protein
MQIIMNKNQRQKLMQMILIICSQLMLLILTNQYLKKKNIIWELIPELEEKRNEQYFEYNRQRPNPYV